MNAKIAKIKQIHLNKNNPNNDPNLENDLQNELPNNSSVYPSNTPKSQLNKFGSRNLLGNSVETFDQNEGMNNANSNTNFVASSDDYFDDSFDQIQEKPLNNFEPTSPLIANSNTNANTSFNSRIPRNYFERNRRNQTPNPNINPNNSNQIVQSSNQNPNNFTDEWEDTFDDRMSKTDQSLKKIGNKVVSVNDGYDRVFRKSLVFMIGSIVSFAFLTLAGINLFFWSQNLFISFILVIFSLIIYTIFTNIFFIILADKLYLWILLGCHFLIIAFFHSFLGSLNLLTFGMALAVVILAFFAYSELEKTQLGSRLFMIGNITGESTRILLTLSTLVICLGVFNNIIAKGTVSGKFASSQNYFSQAFLENDFIINNILIGQRASAPNSVGQSVGRNVGLNTFFMGRSPNTLFASEGGLKKQIDGEVQDATLGDFLANNYKPGQSILTPNELEDQQNKCAKEKISICDGEIEKLKKIKLEIWKSEGYRELNFGLDSVLDAAKFRQVNRQFYRNLITSFGDSSKEVASPNNNSQILPFIPNLSANLLVPSIFTFLLYILLSIIRPVISLFTTFLTWLFWKILRATGFVHIEIENVQAETVNI